MRLRRGVRYLSKCFFPSLLLSFQLVEVGPEEDLGVQLSAWENKGRKGFG